MTVRISAYFLLLIFLFSCHSPKRNIRNDLSRENLKGSIDTVIEKGLQLSGTLRSQEYKTVVYSEQGNKISEEYTGMDTLLNTYYTYDKEGHLLKDTSAEFGRTIYKYGPNGDLIKKERLGKRGYPVTKDICVCDKEGNLIEENQLDVKGGLYTKYTYKYDEKGNEIEMNHFEGNLNLIESSFSTYDEKGNKKDEKWVEHGGDINGGNILYYQYKYENYDKTGNWLKREKYKNFLPFEVLEREIHYYK
jgi:hypothetical protein